MDECSHINHHGGNDLGKGFYIIPKAGNNLGNFVHIIHNSGNNLGKCSPIIHNRDFKIQQRGRDQSRPEVKIPK